MIRRGYSFVPLFLYFFDDSGVFKRYVRELLQNNFFLFGESAYYACFRKCDKVFTLDGKPLPYQSVFAEVFRERRNNRAIPSVDRAYRRKRIENGIFHFTIHTLYGLRLRS